MMKNLFSLCLFTSVIFTFLTPVQAQKCKYDFEKKNPMTDELIRNLSFTIERKYLQLIYYKNGDSYEFGIWHRFYAEMNFSVPEGSELRLRLTNNDIITLKSARKSTPVTSIKGQQIITDYTIGYTCTKEDIIKISQTGIKAFSIDLQNTYNFALKENQILLTKKNAVCFLQD